MQHSFVSSFLIVEENQKSEPSPLSRKGSDFYYSVRITGLEPARHKTPEPKSGASANSATPARSRRFDVATIIPKKTGTHSVKALRRPHERSPASPVRSDRFAQPDSRQRKVSATMSQAVQNDACTPARPRFSIGACSRERPRTGETRTAWRIKGTRFGSSSREPAGHGTASA